MQKTKTSIICFILILFIFISLFFIWEKYKQASVSAELHNAGNIAMQEGKLSQAGQYYRESLDVGEHPDTSYNLSIVEKLLEDNKDEPEILNEDKSDENKNGDSENSEISSGSTQEGEQSKDQGEDEKNNKLTEDEKKQLEKITQQIKSEQNYNQQYYNKSEKGSGFQNAFDSFFGEINRGNKKDW